MTRSLGMFVIHLVTRRTEVLLRALPAHDEGVGVAAEVTLGAGGGRGGGW